MEEECFVFKHPPPEHLRVGISTESTQHVHLKGGPSSNYCNTNWTCSINSEQVGTTEICSSDSWWIFSFKIDHFVTTSLFSGKSDLLTPKGWPKSICFKFELPLFKSGHYTNLQHTRIPRLLTRTGALKMWRPLSQLRSGPPQMKHGQKWEILNLKSSSYISKHGRFLSDF